MNNLLAETESAYPCRQKQIKQLWTQLNQLWPAIMISGSRATAKTAVVRHVCTRLGVFHAWLNCLDHFSNHLIFEHILSQLKARSEGIDEWRDYQYEYRCHELSDFVDQLSTILKKWTKKRRNESSEDVVVKNKCVIVLDDSQQLVADNQLMAAFCNLESLTQHVCHITCVFISNQPLHSFYRNPSLTYPLIHIHFANYTKQEMIGILMHYCPNSQSTDIYENYVNLMVSSLIPYTRNLNEILYFCLRYFDKYCEPIENEENTIKSAKLFTLFKPNLEQIIAKISVKVENKVENIYELPYCVKFLLISAYLASHNSVKSDKKFFVKYQEKRHRKSKFINKDEDLNGPKTFTLERMVHIYETILHLNAENNGNDLMISCISNKILHYVEELVSLKLIYRYGSTNRSNCLSSVSKYQISSIVSLDLVKNLASSLKFDVLSVLE